MDLNKAFATHWDKMNPSAHVEACNHSRKLFEEAQLKREKEKEKERKQTEESDKIYKLLFMDVGNP